MAPLVSILKGIYYGGTPGALRGPEALYQQALKAKVKGVTREKVKAFLASQPIYARHKPARRNYPRNTIDASYPGHVVQVDIMDMQRLKAFNDHSYVLLAYDTFSKLLQGIPLKDREASTVDKGLQTLIDGSPFAWTTIYWDKEGSFLSRKVQAMLKTRNIHNYTTKSVVKAPGVERAIRTLRTLLQRRFEASNSLKWEKELPKIIANYNKRKHSTTKQPPNLLARQPWLPHSVKHQQKQARELPPIGSLVRLNRLRGTFDKEASDTWTEEVFRVVRHNKSMAIPLIYVEDLDGERIEGGLYPEEYQQVTWDGKRQVDKIIKERKLKGKPREYFVSYRGWPPKFNQWIKTRPSL
jgi:hypothetical protein